MDVSSSPEPQATLATQLLTSLHIARQRDYTRCRVWTQDESRCGLLPIVRHRITARGVQPLLSSAYRFESLYLYGAVEPLAAEKKLAFKTEVSSDLPPGRADERRLTQVLLNLVAD